MNLLHCLLHSAPIVFISYASQTHENSASPTTKKGSRRFHSAARSS